MDVARCQRRQHVGDVAKLLRLHTQHDPVGGTARGLPFCQRCVLDDAIARLATGIDNRHLRTVKPSREPAIEHRARHISAADQQQPAGEIPQNLRHIRFFSCP